MSAEIVISVDAAKRNCKVFKTTLGEEIVLYIIHGLLHLLGYDDGTKKDIAKMRKKEGELLILVEKQINKILSRA